MKKPVLLPTWAPRIKPHLLRRLYENDAQGIADEVLLDKAGWALYSRCTSFLSAMQATAGRAQCPACGEVVLHTYSAKEILHCTGCGWECPWRDYLGTIRNQQLNGGPEVVALFQEYVDRFPKASRPSEKMLLIDSLIHGFHYYLTSGRTRRPVGVNLIDGDLQFVVDFLDRLATGPGSTPGLAENQLTWRRNVSKRSRIYPKK